MNITASTRPRGGPSGLKVSGATENLQADHIDPAQKSARIKAVSHNVWSWAKEKRDAELSKCQVLCEPCHQEKTAAWYAARRQHGTVAMYRYCKCPKCCAANTAQRREQRRRGPT